MPSRAAHSLTVEVMPKGVPEDIRESLRTIEALLKGPMRAEEAAEWLGIPLSTFKKRAHEFPRHKLGERIYVYLPDELLEHIREQPPD